MSESESLTSVENTESQSGDIKPVSASERIRILDILRGIAILGILIMNMMSFANPSPASTISETMYPGLINRIVELTSVFLAQGKFYSLFSFLFGLGMAVLLSRSQKKGIRFAPFFARRLGVLLLIGLIHGFIIWDGDILMTYAVLGFVLIAFESVNQKTTMIWAVSFFMIPVLMMVLGFFAMRAFEPSLKDPVKLEEKATEQMTNAKERADKEIQTYSNGTYMEQLKVRAKTTATRQLGAIFYGWSILSMFLLGLWSWRKGIFQNMEEHIPLLKKALRTGLVVGIIGNGTFVWAKTLASPAAPEYYMLVQLGELFGAPALCIFYISAVTLLCRNEKIQNTLKPLAAVGKTALSNYIFQTLVCTTVFYSYGFGLFGLFEPSVLPLLTLVLFIIQIGLSNWWVSRFRFGPLEWVWRSLTYGKRQPMKITQ